MRCLVGLEHVCKLKRDEGLKIDRSSLRKRPLEVVVEVFLRENNTSR